MIKKLIDNGPKDDLSNRRILKILAYKQIINIEID